MKEKSYKSYETEERRQRVPCDHYVSSNFALTNQRPPVTLRRLAHFRQIRTPNLIAILISARPILKKPRGSVRKNRHSWKLACKSSLPDLKSQVQCRISDRTISTPSWAACLQSSVATWHAILLCGRGASIGGAEHFGKSATSEICQLSPIGLLARKIWILEL
jgi:hypothetical protein